MGRGFKFMWPFQKKNLIYARCPGVKDNGNGVYDFTITEEEKAEITEFTEQLQQLTFHPSVVDKIVPAATACALCRYGLDQISLSGIVNDKDKSEENLLKARAAVLKAFALYNLPIFAYHLSELNKLAGFNEEAERLKRIYSERKGKWTPSELDESLLKWLEG